MQIHIQRLVVVNLQKGANLLLCQVLWTMQGNYLEHYDDNPLTGTILQFFHQPNPPGPMTDGINYFRFWLRFR